jgi:hypothetical protein
MHKEPTVHLGLLRETRCFDGLVVNAMVDVLPWSVLGFVCFEVCIVLTDGNGKIQ